MNAKSSERFQILKDDNNIVPTLRIEKAAVLGKHAYLSFLILCRARKTN